jgi:hypothetical protein
MLHEQLPKMWPRPYTSHLLKIKRVGFFLKSRDTSVGIALDYRLDDRGSRVRFPTGARNFSLHHRIQSGSGAHSASYPMGTRGSLGVKRPGREADNSHLSSGDVKYAPNTPSWRSAQW